MCLTASVEKGFVCVYVFEKCAMGVNGSVKSYNIMSQNKHFQVCTLDIYRFFSVAKAGWINSLETFSILNFWSTFCSCISKKTKKTQHNWCVLGVFSAFT